MQTTYRFHNDPGHGWIEVPVAEIEELGIGHLISRFSYLSLDGTRAFLEEDSDGSVFVKAYEAKVGNKPQFEDVYHRRFFTGNPHWNERPGYSSNAAARYLFG